MGFPVDDDRDDGKQPSNEGAGAGGANVTDALERVVAPSSHLESEDDGEGDEAAENGDAEGADDACLVEDRCAGEDGAVNEAEECEDGSDAGADAREHDEGARGEERAPHAGAAEAVLLEGHARGRASGGAGLPQVVVTVFDG